MYPNWSNRASYAACRPLWPKDQSKELPVQHKSILQGARSQGAIVAEITVVVVVVVGGGGGVVIVKVIVISNNDTGSNINTNGSKSSNGLVIILLVSQVHPTSKPGVLAQMASI